jgi:hypothetical protein
VNADTLEPRRHEAPEAWDVETFDKLTSAIAGALVAAVRREQAIEERSS